MAGIGIVGTGISGLHLALRLQQLGVATTLYAERVPEPRVSRLANAVVRFEQTCARERTLRVNHWEFPDFGVSCVHLSQHGDPGSSFCGALSRQASSVDFRVYLPQLLQDYEHRGGRVVPSPVDAHTVVRESGAHDLMVVAAGGRSMAGLFERDPSRSPYTAPQRLMCVGIYLGMAHAEPMGVEIRLIPGVGEIFVIPFYSFGERVSAMNIETVPGGPLEALAHLPYESDPPGFVRAVLDALARYAPEIRERVDDRAFGLTRPIDLLQGGLTPVVRRGWAPTGEGRYAIALGDAWVLNDPILGQGANLGSNCAFALAEMIADATCFDEGFCRTAEQRMWGLARPVTEWSNAALQPTPPHVNQVLTVAAAEQSVADAVIEGWNDPAAAWAALGSPAGAAGFLHRVRAP